MIAYEMLFALTVGLPILVAAVVGSVFLRRHGRAERGIWLLALVLTLALPVIMLSRPPVGVPTPWTPVLESVAIELAPVVVIPAPPEASPAVRIHDVLIALWLLASLSLAIRWAVSSVRLARLRRSWREEVLDGLRVALSPDTGPGVFGILRPRIVVPSWVASLPDAERALVLRHEQEHLRGGDHWLAAVSRVARILTPWHPFVWVLTSRLARAVELDCDRRVLRRHPDVAAYGATLLLVAARGSPELLAAAAFAETDVSLRRRILAMTTPPRMLSAVGLVTALSLGVVLLAGALEVPVPAAGVPVVRLADALEVPTPTISAPLQVPPGMPTSAPREVQQVAQRALPEPRVIANPSSPWRLVAYLVQDDSIPRTELIGTGPVNVIRRDSVFWVGPLRLRPEIVNAQMAWRMLAAQFGDSLRWVLTTAPTSPSDPAPETTVAPRILNPDEIAAAVVQHYPRQLRDRGVGGAVGVQFLVGQTGAVQQTRIGQISAYPALDEAALRVADTYRFSPAFAGEQPIAVWVSHAVDFRAP